MENFQLSPPFTFGQLMDNCMTSVDDVEAYFDNKWSNMRDEALSRDLTIITTIVAIMLLLHYIVHHKFD